MAFSLSNNEIVNLGIQFNSLNEICSFSTDIQFSSLVASYGIFREVGTLNDELARFIFSADSGEAIKPSSLKAELIKWKNLVGVRIWSEDTRRLELRTPGFYDMVHPQLSRNADGSLHSLSIFPEIIKEIAKARGVELVLVKSWGNNSIFGGFDPAKAYYQTNFWELENNDSLKFADLVRQGKLAFMGTHDLIAHVAGIDQKHWPLLKQSAQRVFDAIEFYFKSNSKPSISALILPYTIGVVLDDLAQPPSYSSQGHLAVLDNLLLRIYNNEVPAELKTMLTQFPDSFQKIIDLSRTPEIAKTPAQIQAIVSAMVMEIRRASV